MRTSTGSVISPAEHEASIRESILRSARRMVAGLKVAECEQMKLSEQIAMLDKYGERGAMARLARDTGISRQLVCEVLSGRKKIGAEAAGRMARVKI